MHRPTKTSQNVSPLGKRMTDPGEKRPKIRHLDQLTDIKGSSNTTLVVAMRAINETILQAVDNGGIDQISLDIFLTNKPSLIQT